MVSCVVICPKPDLALIVSGQYVVFGIVPGKDSVVSVWSQTTGQTGQRYYSHSTGAGRIVAFTVYTRSCIYVVEMYNLDLPYAYTYSYIATTL